MSSITLVWTEEKIRAILRVLDQKTDCHSSEIPIRLTANKRYIGTYFHDKNLSFSLLFLNNPNTEESSAIGVIRHEFVHRLVDEKNLKQYFPRESRSSHGAAFRYACGLINAVPRANTNSEYYRKITAEEAQYYSACKDIPDWDMDEIITRLKAGNFTVPHHAGELSGTLFPPPGKIGKEPPRPVSSPAAAVPSAAAGPSVAAVPVSDNPGVRHPAPTPPPKVKVPQPAPPSAKTNGEQDRKQAARNRRYLVGSTVISVILSVICAMVALTQTFAPGTVPAALKVFDISLVSLKFGWRALLTSLIMHVPFLIFAGFLLPDRFPVSEEARTPAAWVAGGFCAVTLVVTSVFLCLFSGLPTFDKVSSIILYFALEILAVLTVLMMHN